MYLGATGVDLFFVLSGFLITGILLDSRRRPDYFRRFYFRRALRIFPLYYLTLFVLLILLPIAFNDRTTLDSIEGDSIHLWMYTSNLAMAWDNRWSFGALEHFWSLAIEEQFYLIWPIVVFYVSPRWLQQLTFAMLIVFTSARVGCSVCGIGEVTEKLFTLFRCDGLLMGAIAAMSLRKMSDLTSLTSFYLRARIVFVISVLFFGASLVLGKHDFTIRYSLVSLLWVSLLACVLSSPKRALGLRFFEGVALRVLGKYSYAMYVFQSPIILLLGTAITPTILSKTIGNSYCGGIAYVGIMFAITLGLAVLSWHGFEKRFLQLKDLGPERA